MYVCICNAITDREIRAAVDSGTRTFHELQSTLGVASCCGRCADCARGVLRAALADEAHACAGAGDD